ncbi:LTXXQ domain protein [Pseudomonas sp.]|uniref:Spy/CpxP family protein refolding chaperone n=1 Tax=Pseudomonas sp. TaxID=306 RepID=UPI0028AF2AE7|nr:LTXXQ domain protein [Pseudomonas sp.]
MRKTLIAALFAATLPTLAMATPEGGGPHHDGGRHAPFEQLDLSADQKQKMQDIMRQQMRSHRDITQRYLAKLPEAQRKAMRDEQMRREEQTRQQIRELLNPEQQKRFDEMHEKMQAKRAERAEYEQWKAERDKKN